MIRIIRPGKYKIDKYIYTCKNCFCEFEYSSEDFVVAPQEKCGQIEYMKKLQCPFCEIDITEDELNRDAMQEYSIIKDQ